MEQIKPIMFGEYKCAATLGRYLVGNRIFINLEDYQTGEPIARATINCPDEELLSEEVVIKDYSENEGMLKALIEAEIITSPNRWTKDAFPICRLLIPCPPIK